MADEYVVIRVPDGGDGAVPRAAGGAVDAAPGDRAALLDAVARLFTRYRDVLLAAGVPIDDFQGYAAEIAALPYKYVSAQRGALFLAAAVAPAPAPALEVAGGGGDSGAGAAAAAGDAAVTVHLHGAGGASAPSRVDVIPVGVVAVKDLGGGTCELKRLYVSPAHRRRGLAGRLCAAAEAAAAGLGHSAVVLDTLERLGAEALYASRGYGRTAAYVHNPMPDVVFMRKELPGGGGEPGGSGREHG
jgi:GNAT superfamily N-acetyltransferase